MNRLTGRMKNNDSYYPHCYESNCDSNCAACDFDYEVLEKLTVYEDLEEKLEKVYGECDGLLETVVNNLIKHEGVDIGKPKKARLLTDEDVDKWEDLKNAEEQGLLLRLPCKIGRKVFYVQKCLAPSCKECKGFLRVDNCYCQYKARIFEQKFDYRHLKAFDKSVFLTKEEAEQALVRMEK